MPDFAMIDGNGVVQNVIVWDGVAAFDTQGLTLVQTHGAEARIGGTWDGSKFLPPPDEVT
jgi:hypothetical protein